MLVLPHPKWMKRIWPSHLLAGGVLAGEDFVRLSRCAVDVVEDAGAPQLRRDLGPPQDIVGAGELLRDSTAERRLEGGGGGRHGCAHLMEMDKLGFLVEEEGSVYHVRLR